MLGDVQRNAPVDVFACLGLASVFVQQPGALGTEKQLQTNLFQTLILEKLAFSRPVLNMTNATEYGERTKTPVATAYKAI